MKAFFALVLAVLIGMASARGNGGCRRRIECAWYKDPLAPADDGKAVSPPGSYRNASGAPGNPPCKATEKAGYCTDLDCIYGWNTLDGCPSCGSHNVGCVCVSYAEMRAENKSTAKVIKIIGWVFLGLMFLYPLTIGWCGVKCIRRHQESSKKWIEQYNTQNGQPAATSLSVMVPPGMKPGQALQVATPGGTQMAVTIPDGVVAGGSFIVTVPPQQPTQVAQHVIMPQTAVHIGGGSGASQGQQQCCCCTDRGQEKGCESCCNSKRMQQFWCQGLPAIIFALIAIGCLAGGYNYNLNKYWSNCRNKK